MDFNNFHIEKIEIEKFKNISNLSINFDLGTNLIYGIERSGKSSVLEFIEYMLYGSDSVALSKSDANNVSGKMTVFSGKDSYEIVRRVTESENDFSFKTKNDSKDVDTELSAGEYLTGLCFSDFCFLCYFDQPRFGLPKADLNDDILKKIAIKKKASSFLNYLSIKEKLTEFHNGDLNGSLDLIDKEKKILTEKISSEETIKEQIDELKTEIADGVIKIEENEKKIVILKADMSQYENDSKLDENIKNSIELKNSIREKEKKYNIIDFELKNKTGKLSREGLEELKDDYNILSAVITKGAELRNKLDSANESLKYHRQLFNNKDSIEYYNKIKNKIKRYSVDSKVASGFSIFFFICAVASLSILLLNKYSMPLCVMSCIAFILAGGTTLMLKKVFKVNSDYSLYKSGLKNDKELNEICEKLTAHDKTDKVYSEQIKAINNEYKNNVFEAEKILNSISAKLKNAGRSIKGEDILEVCDEVIEANSLFYDLEDELEIDRLNCEKILHQGINNQDTKISSDYQNLQKELDFTQKQNDSIIKKRAILESKIAELELQIPNKEKILIKLAEIEEKSKPIRTRYDELCSELKKLSNDKNEFSLKIKNEILNNMKISLPYFHNSESERYSFDENDELCFNENGTNIPLIRFSNGIAEMGIIAFRICIADMIGHKKIPMILDDCFKNKAEEFFNSFQTKLEQSSSQIILASSSEIIMNGVDQKLNCVML